MSEACETCGAGCTTGLIIFLCIVCFIFIYIVIEVASSGALSDWIGERFEHWIDKLPKPKDED